MDHEKMLNISITIIVSVLMIVCFNLWRTNENSKNEAKIELERAALSNFISWFGTEGSCTVNYDEKMELAEDLGISKWVIFESPCPTDILPYTLIWQESGLLGLGILNESEIKDIQEGAYYLNDDTQADIELLLTGGFPIINDDDEEILIKQRFSIAINRIQGIIFNSKDLQSLDVWLEWNSLIQES